MNMGPVVKHFIETLNRENGGARFEQIAASLAEKEICSNILPSTGPFGGGDKGVDLRTHKTFLKDSSSLFRLYSSTPKSTTKKRIIFAFSIQKTWKTKLEKDVEKIVVKNKLKPDEVCFITNQFVKTKDRETEIKALSKKYPKVDFEIYDGEWVTSQLSEAHYDLMVNNFGFFEKLDPHIEEMYQRVYSFRDGGMTDEESVRVKELLQRTSYRVNYADILEQRVIDLKTVADIQSKYTKFIEDSIKSYEEALSELSEVADKVLVVDLYYAYFRALQKLRLHDKIAQKISEFRSQIFDNKLYQYYPYIFTWLFYLLPHRNEVKSVDLVNFAKESLELMEKDILSKVAKHVIAFYDEAILLGKQLLTLVGIRTDDEIQLWRSHIETHKDIQLYSISSIARAVTVLAVKHEGDQDYEDLCDLVEKILVSRNEKLEVAQFRKDRAMSLFNAGKYEMAIRHLNIVKIYWYEHETLRGSLLTCWALSECYAELGLYYASLHELFSILHVTTLDEDTHAEHKDLFIKSLIFIYNRYMQIGLFGSAIIMGKYAVSAIAKYREDPKLGDNDTPFTKIFEGNTYLTLVSLRNKFGKYADRVLSVISGIAPQIENTFKMFFEETDEEFSKGWEGAEDQLEGAKKFRDEIRSGKYADLKNTDIHEPINESETEQYRSFTYKDVEFSITFDNQFMSKKIAEHLLSYIQEIIVFVLNDKDSIVWIESKITLHIIFDKSLEKFQVREKANNDAVELDIALNPSFLEKDMFNNPFSDMFRLEQLIFSGLLLQCTINKSDEIKSFLDNLAKDDFFEGLTGRIPYGYVFNTFFVEEEYKLLLEKT